MTPRALQSYTHCALLLQYIYFCIAEGQHPQMHAQALL
jgi:hypothetical protein